MNDPSATPDITGNQSPEMERLKSLLLSEESTAIDSIKDQVDEIADPEFIGKTLPEAIVCSHHQAAEALARALQTPLVEAIQLSSSSNRANLSSALFPIIGPAIRLYVSDTFRSMFDQLNENIRAATSIRRIKWWFDAKLAGKDFSEYVLLKTLNYQIENLLLIAPDSGLLLQQVARNPHEEENPELVSSMLIAIRSFVRDSFSNSDEDNEELGRFSFGEKEIFIENGPKAILAAVSIGNPPPAYREDMRTALETIHAEESENLENFSGDPDSIAETAQPELRPLLREHKAKKDVTNAFKWRAWAFLALIAALCIFAIFQKTRDRMLAHRMVETVKNEPGVELLQLNRRAFSTGQVSLLRDPLATSVSDLLAESKIPADWSEIIETPFISLEEPFVSQREKVEARKETEVREAHRTEFAAIYSELEKRDKVHNETRESDRKEFVELSSKIQNLANTTALKSDHVSLVKSEFFRKYPIQDSAELTWIGDYQWKLTGSAMDPYFTRIHENKDNLLAEGGVVSLDGLTQDMDGELNLLRDEIETLTIEYHDGKNKITPEGLRNRATILKKLTRIVALHEMMELPEPVVHIYATKIVGVRKGPNLILANSRTSTETAAIEESKIGGHLKIETFLDSILTPKQKGVYLKLKNL